MNDLDRYSFLWEKPFRYVLGPIPSYIDRQIYFGDAKYATFTKEPLSYSPFGILSEHAVDVIDKMIAEGVEILEYIPIETLEEQVTHLWTDKVNEFILIRYSLGYRIFHKVFKEYVYFHKAPSDLFAKMIEAGVEISDNENPSTSSEENS